jgi:hypothetical protein
MAHREEFRKKHRRHCEHHRHPQVLAVLFARIHRHRRKIHYEDTQMPNLQLIATDTTKGFALVLAELLAGAPFPLTAGPFTVAFDDPNGTVTRTPGSADQTTPDTFFPNGSGAVGTVTVTVTDQSVPGGLVGVGAFDVVAPVPPPPQPDTLQVSFAPISTAGASSAPAAAAVKGTGATGDHGAVGDLGTNKP